MRMYQEIGLKPEACAWLEEHAARVTVVTCPHCGRIVSDTLEAEVYERRDSFYGAGPALRRYRLKDGGTVREIVQVEPRSSGPMAFFCLEAENGTWFFPWTGKDVNEVEKGLVEDTDEVVGRVPKDMG